ncbi:MAG: hypothetical protein RR898_06940 [Clostridium sp.]|uniref:phage tail protein n=1 Tax=Clostridium sp. TaxID=1506 RepID=UPI002FCAA974
MLGGITLAPLLTQIKVNIQGFKSEMDKAKVIAEKKVKEIEKEFKIDTTQLGNSLQGIGAGLTAMGATGVAAIGGLVAKGAEWNAQVAGTEFLYKNLDKSVQKSIKSNMANAKSIGLTEQQYKDAATTMATYYTNMGFTSKETSKLSGETMNLVADLAAVTDMPFDEAMGRFKSGLMGNYEALDSFGINISANMLENSKYVKSLGKTWNQLSENEKMMAVYNEVQRQGSSATGLAAQEAGGFSMQLKMAKQEAGELAGKLGETLLPIMEPLLSKMKETVGKLTEWVEENPKMAQTVLTAVAALSGFLLILGPIIVIVGTLITNIGAIITGFTAVSAAVTGAGGAIALLSNPIGWIIGAIGLLVAAVMTDFAGIRTTISSVMGSIAEIIRTILARITYIWNTDFMGIKTFITGIWSAIQVVFSTAFNVIKGLFDVFAKIFKGDWQGAWEGIKNIGSTIWEGIKKLFAIFLNLIVDTLVNIGASLYGAAKTVFLKVKNGFLEIWDKICAWFKKAINDPVGTIKGIGTSMYNAGKDIFNSLWEGAKNIWKDICNWVTDKVNWIVDKVKFWDNESEKMSGKADGSHFNGLSYVPFDGYTARLHKGERVLTAEENKSYIQGRNINGSSQTFIFNSPKAIDEKEAQRLFRRSNRELSYGI